MDEISRLTDSVADPIAVKQKIETLLRENAALRDTVATLREHLRAEGEDASGRLAQQQISQLREANQHLVLATFGAQDSTTAAKALNERQTVFLSMLAHELRNPMASIAIANTVMESLNLAHPSVARLLAITRRQISHLVRLVDDLLDASRISTGKISLQTHMILLNEVIDSAMETAQPSLANRRLPVRVDLPPAPVVLLGDMVRLSQLFANLLINASKFSDVDDTILVTASVQDGQLVVAVKDEGKGIALEFQPGIFDLFSQGADVHDHSSAGGLGIGLSLVRTIAEMHGGSVRVESAGPGCGSEFVVVLPLPAISASGLHLADGRGRGAAT
ncbi:HAMP domain-containing histidine kinase [Massilia sp. RP-1-19]|uniref:histidine kinase n=1 Tax=Massilia polaris TaxID=2728846 RepID=A0A848HTX3_9BURK|nr:HAMP domain-containing sensor histidine kinase [Massilia polaris]NML63530.1 HAMP domain-containing histidine kinase [Massilia polaris]